MEVQFEQQLQKASALQKNGRFADAAQLYQSLARQKPDDPRPAFGMAMLELARGNTSAALIHLEENVRLAPGQRDSKRWLARCYRALGHNSEAVKCYEECGPPLDPGELLELGEARLSAGQLVDGSKTLDEFIRQTGGHPEAMMHAGLAFHQSGMASEAAEYYRQALAADPGLQLARRNLAAIHQTRGDFDEAERLYRKVLESDPGNHEVLQNLGTLLKDMDRLTEAFACYEKAMRLLRLPCPGDPIRILQKDPAARMTSIHHLKLQAEQIEYLGEKGKLPSAFRGLARKYREVIEELPARQHASHRIALDDSQFARVGPTCGRLIRVTPAAAVPGGALNPALDTAAISREYLARNPGLAVIDDFLSATALQRLRDYCIESTIWFDYGKAGGYCGSYMQDGFGNGLLCQLAVELRERLPDILGRHALNQLWGYIYDSDMSGITAHADSAAVNLNFWITPDEANLNRDKGGLVVYTTEAPKEWDFSRYNNDHEAIEAFVAESDSVVVPYRCNRAVLFHSNLIHKTDDIEFRSGLLNRRINITMLFGQRDA